MWTDQLQYSIVYTVSEMWTEGMRAEKLEAANAL